MFDLVFLFNSNLKSNYRFVEMRLDMKKSINLWSYIYVP